MTIVKEPNSDNCLGLIFVASHREKVIFVSDKSIRKKNVGHAKS